MTRRVALVTGASSGIGAAIAIGFGEIGWAVGIGARRIDKLEQTAQAVRDAGGEAFAHVLDVTDPESVDAWFDASVGALGRVDAVVNNAGTTTPGWFHELTVEDLHRDVATNLLGPMYVTRRAVAALREQDTGGDVVFISSDASTNPRPRMTPYTASKGGLELLARSLSMELEGTGIRSTTVRVGPTSSEFGFSWDLTGFDELLVFWQRFGLQRHLAVMDASAIARAVVFAVTSPPGVHVDTIEVQPEAPSEHVVTKFYELPPGE